MNDVPESPAQTIARLEHENGKLREWNKQLSADLDEGDSWAWIRGKFEKCRTQFKWYTPRTDGLVGTRYEVMGWLHVLFAHADPKVYMDITIEQQKKADDAEAALAEQRAVNARLVKDVADRTAESERLTALLNTPETEDFDKAVPLEAAHQVIRWGAQHDEGKNVEDWFWLVGYLAGKALAAQKAGDLVKAKHHTISTSAALRNWHAHLRSGESLMRPGISAEKAAIAEEVGANAAPLS